MHLMEETSYDRGKKLKDYFNCDRDPLSAAMYDGKHMGFFAVVDDIQDGRDFAAAIPGEQRPGMAVFAGTAPEIHGVSVSGAHPGSQTTTAIHSILGR